MKNMRLFITLFFSAFIVSCTVINYSYKHTKAAPVILKPAPDPQPVIKPMVILAAKDTVVKVNTVERIKRVAILDTAALSYWFQRFEEKLIENESEQSQFIGLINEYRDALRQNQILIEKYSKEKQEKEEIKEAANVAQKVMIDVPTVMYSLLVLVIFIIAIRQQYLKRKLERQIENIRTCRIENQR